MSARFPGFGVTHPYITAKQAALTGKIPFLQRNAWPLPAWLHRGVFPRRLKMTFPFSTRSAEGLPSFQNSVFTGLFDYLLLIKSWRDGQLDPRSNLELTGKLGNLCGG